MVYLKETTSITQRIKEKGLVRFIIPKAVKIFSNMLRGLLRLGPRLIFRSGLNLLKANPITRFFSVISLVILDIWLLIKKKISKNQFVINVVFSFSMFVGGAIGWSAGENVARIFMANTVLAFLIALVGTIIGTKIFDVISKKIVTKFAISDVHAGLAIFNACADATKDYYITREECLEAFRLNSPRREDYARARLKSYESKLMSNDKNCKT
ncbi:MAG: hypothetical protein FWE02_03465 [Defluviitaleaceae bacterium]|nr:hypothetical protein [Defluviitaleaceae bacterium]